MQIVLLRHGIAIDRDDPAAPAEPERALTEKGIARTTLAMHGVAHLELAIDLVLTSPWTRALQTAEIACRINAFPTAQPSDALLWEEPPARLLNEISLTSARGVLCVGHSPHLDNFLAYMLGNDFHPARLKKSGVAVMECGRLAAGQGALLGLYPPRVLRLLGKRPKSESSPDTTDSATVKIR